MIHTWTLQRCIDYAKKLTANAAEVKDWRVRNKFDREMREIAKDMTAGKGYIIATPIELDAKYPGKLNIGHSDEDATRKIIWGVIYSRTSCVGSHKFSFVHIR